MSETYFTRPWRITLAVEGAAVGGTLGAMLTGAAEDTAWERPGLVVLVLLAALGLWRGATARVVADRDGLVVRNVYRTHRVRWADVVRVTECEPWPYRLRLSFRCPCLVVRGRRARVKLVAMLDLGDARFDQTVKAWKAGRH